jgi:hypothetical protein
MDCQLDSDGNRDVEIEPCIASAWWRGGFEHEFLEQHPWLGKGLKIAGLKIKKFEMKERGMDWVARGWWQTTPKAIWGFQWCLETLGMKQEIAKGKMISIWAT